MVFHEIESITDVVGGHRIIIYYIEGKSSHQNKKNEDLVKLFSNTIFCLEMLEKKNDDLLLVRIPHESESFKQFEELYRPEVTGILTLFAVNNGGIPIVNKQISEVKQISSAIEQLSTACKLNIIPSKDLVKLNSTCEKILPKHLKMVSTNSMEFGRSPSTNSVEENVKDLSKTNAGARTADIPHSPGTKVQIRLPSGTKEEERFDSDTTLQEVWIIISTKYNIKDFDLKMYNRPIFSECDYEKTLQELDLCPSGVITVVNKNIAPNNNVGRLRAFIEYGVTGVMASTRFVFNYMQGVFFVFWNYIFPSSNGSTSRRNGHKEIKSSSGKPDQSSARSGTKRSIASKNIGNNIHTLRRNEDSDSDENNRYNGNSTQQK